jgi:hypothetical protein
MPLIDVIAMAGSLAWLIGGAIGAWAGIEALGILRDLGWLVRALSQSCGGPI